MVELVTFSALPFLALAYGFLSLTKETLGVGLIGITCLFLIMGVLLRLLCLRFSFRLSNYNVNKRKGDNGKDKFSYPW